MVSATLGDHATTRTIVRDVVVKGVEEKPGNAFSSELPGTSDLSSRTVNNERFDDRSMRVYSSDQTRSPDTYLAK